MYKRLESIFCGYIRVSDALPYMERGELLIRPSLAVLTEVDRAVAECIAVCIDRLALGSSAIGKVIDTGVGVDPTLEGKRVCVRPWCGLAPVERDGFAQEVARVPEECVEAVPREVSDVDAAISMFLAVSEEQLEEITAREVLVIGRDPIILPFAMRAKKLASRVFSVPSETPVARHLGIEATSITGRRSFDVVVVASLDPAVVNASLSMCRDGCVALVHPIALHLGIARPRASCRIEAIELENLARGLRMLREARPIALKLFKFFRGLNTRALYASPALLHLSSKDDRYSKRDRK
ncbi:MAG: hypothetical protein GXO32_07830 [Crenarchaeota archaeon]|nr:hypothetical protein [Thermoproteota archaeon]